MRNELPDIASLFRTCTSLSNSRDKHMVLPQTKTIINILHEFLKCSMKNKLVPQFYNHCVPSGTRRPTFWVNSSVITWCMCLHNDLKERFEFCRMRSAVLYQLTCLGHNDSLMSIVMYNLRLLRLLIRSTCTLQWCHLPKLILYRIM